MPDAPVSPVMKEGGARKFSFVSNLHQDGKIGEGGVAIDTVEDMERLFHGFALGDERLSVSMTINGPAPMILAFLAYA